MWTPKRILIFIGGLILFSASYALYSRLLGGIDGLPELPEKYWFQRIPQPPKLPETLTDKKIKEAFGEAEQCPELSRKVKLWMGSRLLGLAVDIFKILPDGRVELSPFSACIYARTRTDGKFPEINVVRCDEAVLTLDRKVKTYNELADRKIVAIELRDNSNKGVWFANNRGSKNKFGIDSLEVTIKNAPVIYDDKLSLISSDGDVTVIDYQTNPNPTQVKAKGFELQLTREGSNASDKNVGKGKRNGEGVTGAESLLLLSDVDMQLWIDPRSGFLADPQGKEAAPARQAKDDGHKAKEPAEKAHLTIKTKGRFQYDLVKEEAHFSSPKAGTAQDRVVVAREVKQTNGDKIEAKCDTITCDQLELKFRPKQREPQAGGSRAGSEGGMQKEIDFALATAVNDREVELMMDSDGLKCYGTSMSYFCAKEKMGPRSIIHGRPGRNMRAQKDGHEIQAPELTLISADQKGQGQQAIAKGPGLIELADPASKSKTGNSSPQRAEWSDSLKWSKVLDGGHVFELLEFTGISSTGPGKLEDEESGASFRDEEHKQAIKAQRLKLWMEPGGPAGQESGHGNLRPRRLEAYGKVSMMSPEMIVDKTEGWLEKGDWPHEIDLLVINFKDQPPRVDKLPRPAPVAPDGVAAPIKANNDDTRTLPQAGNPIRLRAREIVADVVRDGAKSELQELTAKNAVQVLQNGKTEHDKGVDIQGELLTLYHFGQKGDILDVYGPTEPAYLQMDEMKLVGAKVTINQKENSAAVEGIGSMRMPSNTALDGSKATRPGSILTVHWIGGMVFDGRTAVFTGGVTADQDNSKLLCLNLQVTLDKPVSFKEGQKGGQAARVDIMVCDRKVFVQDQAYNSERRPTKDSKASFTQLKLENLDGITRGYGPGYVAFWGSGGGSSQLGSLEPRPFTAVNGSSGGKLTLTRVEFDGQLFSIHKEPAATGLTRFDEPVTTRLTKFRDNVKVFHLPADRPDVNFNHDTPPKDGFYLDCNLLTIKTRQIAGKSTQVMEAEDRVVFRTDEFVGRADKLVFDEATDTIVFTAKGGNPVFIKQRNARGEELQGRKILYNRRTGEFKIEGSTGLTGNQ